MLQPVIDQDNRSFTKASGLSYIPVLDSLQKRAKTIYKASPHCERDTIFVPLLDLLTRAVKEPHLAVRDPDADVMKKFLIHLSVPILTKPWVLQNGKLWALFGDILVHFEETQSYYSIAPNIYNISLPVMDRFGDLIFRARENANVSERRDCEPEKFMDAAARMFNEGNGWAISKETVL